MLAEWRSSTPAAPDASPPEELAACLAVCVAELDAWARRHGAADVAPVLRELLAAAPAPVLAALHAPGVQLAGADLGAEGGHDDAA